MPIGLWIGTSGWGYPDWHAKHEQTQLPFYPQSIANHQRLAFYSEIFPTVEINTSFYSPPRTASVQKWYQQVPEYFIFSYKIPRTITHKKKLREDYFLDLTPFLETMTSALRKKIGPALLQLPPRFSSDYFNDLKVFLQKWPSELRLAVEFRDLSWIERPRYEETMDLLMTHNIAYCIVDEPLLPPLLPVTSDFVYMRFHGHGLKPWYNYLYSIEELRSWKSKLQEITQNKQLRDIYVYFNNHPHGSAPNNARQLAILLKQDYPTPNAVDLTKVRKKAGDPPQISLERFLGRPELDMEDYVRFCERCGEMVLKDDKFCQECGSPIASDSYT
ncbi:MAG: DUF72 domain-containing protein [Candidatus Thorarchaeota archaeon]